MKQKRVDIKEIITEVVSYLPDCIFTISDIEGIFPDGKPSEFSKMFKVIEVNKEEYKISSNALKRLANIWEDPWTFELAAYESEKNYRKYAHLTGDEFLSNAYFFLDITDAQVFEINCKDPKIDKILKDKYLDAWVESKLYRRW